MNFRYIGFIPVLALAVSLVAQAQLAPPGAVLTPAQRASLKKQPSVSVMGQNFSLLGTVSSSGETPATAVVNPGGVVGYSHHEVIVSNLDPAVVKPVVSSLGSSLAAADYFPATKISVLRFNTFAEAVAARNQLAQALPQAKIALPIAYSTHQVR